MNGLVKACGIKSRHSEICEGGVKIFFYWLLFYGISEETLSSSNPNFPYTKSLLNLQYYLIYHKVDFYIGPHRMRGLKNCQIYWKMLLAAF